MRQSKQSCRLTGSAAVIGFGVLALVACTPPHPKPKPPLRTISSLDCPESQGDLNRKSAATDGKSCVYTTDGGDQVTLRLINLGGKDPRDVLEPIEKELKAELPAATTDATKPPKTPVTPSAPGAPAKQHVDIDLPGLHVHGDVDGHTDVDTPGVHVEAHDGADRSNDHAVVHVGGGSLGGVTINANDGGAQIRVAEKGAGIRSIYILASEKAGPHGYKAAGYEARGPVGGPIVVATVLAKSEEHEDIHHDLRSLLKRNVGT